MTAARDPEDLKARLNCWIPGRAELASARVERAVAATGGASSETWLLDLADGQPGWVLRIESRGRQIYENPSVARQFAVIRALMADPALPVPAALALEEDETAIGAPFFVMERASGEAPPNAYHTQGLIAAASSQERSAMARSSLALLARLHALDPAPFAFLGWPGGDAIAQELGRWDSYRAWAGLPPIALFDRARAWLEEHRPAPQPPGFAWGDARPANILFAGARPSALLDWETASLGGAESDLGWWLFYDRMITEEEGVPPLPGWPDAAETLRLWEAASGRAALAMDWHLAFAGYRFALISERARALAIAAGLIPDTARGFANPAVRLLSKLLD